MNLKYTVQPGKRQFVRGILVRGLEHTNPALVDSRITLSPGDPISQSRMGESQQKLYDLGIFSKVQTALQNPEGDEDSKYVLVHLDEARKYSFNAGLGAELARIGGGVTTFDAPAGETAFSPRVSLGVSRINFLGLGHIVGVQTLVSTLEQRALFTYLAPQFEGHENLALTFSALFDNSHDVRTFAAHRWEGSVQLSQKVSRARTIQYRYTFRRVSISDLAISSASFIPLLSQPGSRGVAGVFVHPGSSRRSSHPFASRLAEHRGPGPGVEMVRVADRFHAGAGAKYHLPSDRARYCDRADFAIRVHPAAGRAGGDPAGGNRLLLARNACATRPSSG